MICIALLLARQAPPSDGPFTPDSLRATIEKMASWNTRNTSTPELTATVEWAADQFSAIPNARVEIMKYAIHQGPRIPADNYVVEVLATFPPNVKTEGTAGIVAMGGHLDSINMTEGADVFKSRAPGANDDGSGFAATLATARWMANRPHSHPLLFIGFSGEEQGLLGSEAIAARADREKWAIDAVLSNDIIGTSSTIDGEHDNRHVRVFSEDPPKTQSRELARYIEWLNRQRGPKGDAVKLVFRSDRFGRGGDHSSFNKYGFTAVRFCEMVEEYAHQHTSEDLPQYVDYDYLSKNARVNAAVVDSLANAGPPPTRVRMDRRQNHDAAVTWTATPGVKYIVYWRDTASPTWDHFKEVGAVNSVQFKRTSKDENVFAVGAEGGIPVEAL